MLVLRGLNDTHMQQSARDEKSQLLFALRLSCSSRSNWTFHFSNWTFYFSNWTFYFSNWTIGTGRFQLLCLSERELNLFKPELPAPGCSGRVLANSDPYRDVLGPLITHQFLRYLVTHRFVCCTSGSQGV